METRAIHNEKKEPPSAKEIQEEVRHLKQMLAEKEEKLSRTISRRQLRRLAQHENMFLLIRTEAELKKSQKVCDDLEQMLRGSGDGGGQSEAVRLFHEEFFKKKRALREQFLAKEEQMEDRMWQRLSDVEEDFKKRLLEEREKNKQELMERERRMRQVCEERRERIEKKLSAYCEEWESRAWKWKAHKSNLNERIKEQVNLRERQEEENRQEAERLRAEIQQLQVRSCRFVLSLLFPWIYYAKCAYPCMQSASPRHKCLKSMLNKLS